MKDTGFSDIMDLSDLILYSTRLNNNTTCLLAVRFFVSFCSWHRWWLAPSDCLILVHYRSAPTYLLTFTANWEMISLLKNKSSQSAGACHSRTTAGCVWSTFQLWSTLVLEVRDLLDRWHWQCNELRFVQSRWWSFHSCTNHSHTCVLTYVGIIIDYFVILFFSTNY